MIERCKKINKQKYAFLWSDTNEVIIIIVRKQIISLDEISCHMQIYSALKLLEANYLRYVLGQN
jgi:hypothetical protein